MREWFSEFVRNLAWLLLGLALGGSLGHLLNDEVIGLVLGGISVLAWIVTKEALRARRLSIWMANIKDQPVPQMRGWWSELVYRVQTLKRSSDRSIQQERDNLTQFLQAIQASPNGVLLLDPEDQIVWCNRTGADHFGLDPDGDVGQPITNLVRSPEFVSHLQNIKYDDTLVFANSRGGPSVLSVIVRTYGRNMKLLISQDVSERDRQEAMRRDFVANVSHEIRTPLTVLSGFLETMENLPLTDVERQRITVLMRQQTDRIQDLVTDLLTLAQLEGSPRPTTDQWFSILSLIQRIWQDAQAVSQGQHHFIDAFTPALRPDNGAGLAQAPEDWQLAGVQSEIVSAMSNLVTNAIRYTPPGKDIEIGWHFDPDGAACFFVKDAGMGIAAEHIPRLTQRFYRVDTSRARSTGGTGLGLSIVKHVMERHGGEILIQSTEGQGSTFILRWPATRLRKINNSDLS